MAADPKVIEFRCVYGGKRPIVGDVWYRMPEVHGNSAERYNHYMCAALFMLMHTPSDCSEILELIDAVTSGKSQEEGYGLNDTCVTFRQNEAQVDILIEDEIGTAEGRFSLAEFQRVVIAWKEFLLMPDSEASRLQLELP
ncbi:hypothetical protein [Rhodoferax sp. U11-2br]|uniref:hypothetical protein n=1 Tax=Rhodoferax sp. U11-2br TaxID=2838878 RepID=UPI001BE4EA7D|nr:hypothetical protein [Rhodoferax sp. U11-2br]MBT3068776.1 hypothetical protein [Rhodoferax sp. U11-2br]